MNNKIISLLAAGALVLAGCHIAPSSPRGEAATFKESPSVSSIAFDGQEWRPWRTMFTVQGDKLVSLPKARPGFNYGHAGGGRGPELVAEVGNRRWKDYRAEFEYCVTGPDPSFNPMGLSPDYHDGAIWFHLADAKENWNECGVSTYVLGVNGDGSWFLRRTYNEYCAVPSGFGNRQNGAESELAKGTGLKIDRQRGNKYVIQVQGQRIQIWVDGARIVDFTDGQMAENVDGQTLDHGGLGFVWGYDAMGWIRHFSIAFLDGPT